MAAAVLMAMAAAVAAPERGGYPLTIGVGVHFGVTVSAPYQADSTQKAIEQFGFDSVRDDISMRRFQARGDRTRPLDPVMDLLRRQPGGGRPVIALTPGSKQQFGGTLPTAPAALGAYADFAVAAAASVRQDRPLLEIWNEWNLGFSTGGGPRLGGSPESYLALVAAAAPRIRQAAPGATILVGAVGSDIDPDRYRNSDWTWTRKAIDMGLLRYGDGLSVHLYNACRPVPQRTAAEMIGRLTKLDELLRQSTGGKEYPIYVTEVGWPSQTGKCGFTDEAAAANAAQFLLSVPKIASVKGVWLYELKDSRLAADDLQSHFGLVDLDYQPKGVACGVRDTMLRLRNASFQSFGSSGGITRVTYRSGPLTWSAVWTDPGVPGQAIIIPAGGTARRICGGAAAAAGQRIALSVMPTIIEIGKGR